MNATIDKTLFYGIKGPHNAALQRARLFALRCKGMVMQAFFLTVEFTADFCSNAPRRYFLYFVHIKAAGARLLKTI